jgi:hypothetical protein
MISEHDKRMANLIPRNEPPLTRREWYAGLAMTAAYLLTTGI